MGATTSIFPFTESMKPYLRSTHRSLLLQRLLGLQGNESQLFHADLEAVYDQVITVDLSRLEPHINGPFTPDLSTPLSQFKDAVKINEWPESFGAGLIGSCTNSSYQDMTRAENIVKQAVAAGLEPKAEYVTLSEPIDP